MYENSIEMQSLWTFSVTEQWHSCSSHWCDSVCAVRVWVRLFLDLRLLGQAFSANLYHSYGQNTSQFCSAQAMEHHKPLLSVRSGFVWAQLLTMVLTSSTSPSLMCVTHCIRSCLRKVQLKWIWGFQVSEKRRKSNMRPGSLEFSSVLVPTQCQRCDSRIPRAERQKDLRLIPWKSCLLCSLEVGCVDNNKKKIHPMV